MICYGASCWFLMGEWSEIFQQNKNGSFSSLLCGSKQSNLRDFLINGLEFICRYKIPPDCFSERKFEQYFTRVQLLKQQFRHPQPIKELANDTNFHNLRSVFEPVRYGRMFSNEQVFKPQNLLFHGCLLNKKRGFIILLQVSSHVSSRSNILQFNKDGSIRTIVDDFKKMSGINICLCNDPGFNEDNIINLDQYLSIIRCYKSKFTFYGNWKYI